jgi:nucleotide-binding universal stress UspA family protein
MWARHPRWVGVTLKGMTVVIWVAENTWQACVDAARSLAPPGAGITLLTVVDSTTAEAAQGAFSGLLGRGGAGPAPRVLARAETAANDLLDRAQARLGRDADRLPLNGRGKHEIAAAVGGATMLIVARDGHGPGPKSMGKDVRFVVDHAPCPVLLVWPGPPPPVPPPPPPGAHRPPPPPGERQLPPELHRRIRDDSPSDGVDRGAGGGLQVAARSTRNGSGCDLVQQVDELFHRAHEVAGGQVG